MNSKVMQTYNASPWKFYVLHLLGKFDNFRFSVAAPYKSFVSLSFAFCRLVYLGVFTY